MKQVKCKTIFIGLMLMVSNFAYAGPIDRTYWNRAVDMAETSMPDLPCDMVEIEIVSDRQGKVVETRETRVRMVKAIDHSIDQSIDLELVSMIENGDDKTVAFAREFSDHKTDILAELSEGGLFGRDIMKDLNFTCLVFDDHHAVYWFRMTVEGIEFIGQARIDTRTGCPVHSRIKAERLEEGGIVLTNYVETIEYSTVPESWFPKTITETMDICMKGFISTFEGRVRVETRIKNEGLSIPDRKAQLRAVSN